MVTLTSTKFLSAAALLSLAVGAVQAGQPVVQDGKTSKNVVEFSPFEKGNKEFQLGIGYNFSLNGGSDKRPDTQDLDLHLRLGWMLTSPAGDGFCRGNWELLAEAFGAAITEGPGDVIFGGTVLLRYNFVQPDAKWVPYFQIGAGGVYSDISDDPVQRQIGQDFSFNLQAALGVRYMLSNHSALFVEGGYRHLSNADSADRNLGLNSLGVQVGASWFW